MDGTGQIGPESAGMSRSVAFKCTYNDGDEGASVGFNGTCSLDNIRRNLLAGRVWCNSSECRQFYDSGMQGREPQRPCYESELFQKWRFCSGVYQSGPKAGESIPMVSPGKGKIAVLTTRFPGESEAQRKIIGAFRIGKVTDNCEVSAAPDGRVRLTLDEAMQLHFWAYYGTPGDQPFWGYGLFRYLEDGQVHRLLVDVADTVRDEGVAKEVGHLIAAMFDDADAPPANGCLAALSHSRKSGVAAARKYGPGGEGPEHKALKAYLAKNPDVLGLDKVTEVEVEHPFISGDSVDLLFSHSRNRYTVVEVETANPLPGAHQAIKYRALLCAEKGLALDDPTVKAMVVAPSIPSNVSGFCERYGIVALMCAAPD